MTSAYFGLIISTGVCRRSARHRPHRGMPVAACIISAALCATIASCHRNINMICGVGTKYRLAASIKFVPARAATQRRTALSGVEMRGAAISIGDIASISMSAMPLMAKPCRRRRNVVAHLHRRGISRRATSVRPSADGHSAAPC